MMVRRVCKHFFCTATTPKPWLFVGLGNPGDKFKGTRHNVGFEMIDAFAASQGILVDNIHCKAIFGKGFVDDVPVFLAKPQTYMNLSGESCGPLVAYYKLPLDRVVVFHDDMDLPCGVLRLHHKGGHGNHNGLKSVINHFHGNEDFPRLRIGIGKPLGQMNTKAFLLQKFNVTAQERIDAALQEAVVALRQVVSKGLTESGRCFNRKQKYKHRRPCISSSRNSSVLDNEIEATQPTSLNNMKITSICCSDILLSPLFPNSNVALEDAKIELVDNVSWLVSSGLAKVWRGGFEVSETESAFSKEFDEVMNYETSSKECPDLDEIEDMRITGNLFYKIDKDSREFEENSFDFHRRKSYKGERAEGKKENQSCDMSSEVEKAAKKNKKVKKNKEKGSSKHFSTSEKEGLVNLCKNDHLIVSQHEMDSSSIEKRQRRPSFYQLTAPYHEPFCLDIYISRESVRSCIIHRTTSKVVAVAHSISKDFKFDLASTKNRVACAAIGEVLAQRALADDIHNVVYTPRKGEKLEGKLQIVLQSIIDNGVDVKVKIKQRKQGY